MKGYCDKMYAMGLKCCIYSTPIKLFDVVRNLWTKTDMEASENFNCTVEPQCAIVFRVSK